VEAPALTADSTIEACKYAVYTVSDIQNVAAKIRIVCYDVELSGSQTYL
jgi:hypothetical protein